MIALPTVNLLAVGGAALGSFVWGGIFWGLFTKTWLRLLGMKREQLKMGPVTLLTGAFLPRILIAYVLALFLSFARAKTLLSGAEMAGLVWLGFVFTLFMAQTVFEGRSWKAFAIGMVEALIGIIVMGAILGAWT